MLFSESPLIVAEGMNTLEKLHKLEEDLLDSPANVLCFLACSLDFFFSAPCFVWLVYIGWGMCLISSSKLIARKKTQNERLYDKMYPLRAPVQGRGYYSLRLCVHDQCMNTR